MSRGQPSAPPIPMTETQRQSLLSLSRKHHLGQQLAKRIQILLLASEGHSNSEVRRRVGVALNTVKSRRKRWLDSYDSLLEADHQLSQDQLSRSEYQSILMLVIKDIPRSGAPKVITLAQEQQIVALASEQPSNHGIEMTSWSHQMLAKAAIAKGIIKSVSPAQVGRILKKSPLTAA